MDHYRMPQGMSRLLAAAAAVLGMNLHKSKASILIIMLALPCVLKANLQINVTTIAGSEYSPISIDASGSVLAQARFPDTNEGQEDLFLINPHGTVTNLTNGGFANLGGGSLNDLGQYALRSGTEVHFFNGSTFQNSTNGIFSGDSNPASIRVEGQALNNIGQIAIGTSDAVYFYDGNTLEKITEGTTVGGTGSWPVSINCSGQMAFLGLGATRAAYLFDGVGFIDLSSDSSLGIVNNAVGGRVVVNDQGNVVFSGRTSSNVIDIFFYDGVSTVNLSDKYELPVFNNIADLALNNDNQVSFLSGSTGGIWGFFDLDTRQRDQITSGSSFTSGALFMNDSGEVVARGRVAGVVGVQLASVIVTPRGTIPEPATAVLVGIGGLLLMRRRRIA